MYLAFDNRRTSQHDAVRLDGALKAAADRQFLCGDGAFHFGAVRDAHNGSVKLAFDSTKDIQGSSLEILPTTVMPGPMQEISVESDSAKFAGVKSCNCGAGGKGSSFWCELPLLLPNI